MDNLKYYNDSMAYDFEMFMPRSAEPVRKDNIVKLPRTKHQQRARKRAVKHLSTSAFAVMTTIFVIAAMCGNIFLRLEINEYNSKINDAKSEINRVKRYGSHIKRGVADVWEITEAKGREHDACREKETAKSEPNQRIFVAVIHAVNRECRSAF